MPMFNQNFLSTVLLRLDLQSNIEGIGKDTPKTFIDGMKKSGFNKYQSIETMKAEVQFSKEGKSLKIKDEANEHLIIKEDESSRFQLAENYISFTQNKYSNLDTFINEFKPGFDLYKDHYKIDTFKRIGLRYINQIKVPTGKPLDWNGYINKKLLSFLNYSVDEGKKLARCITTVVCLEDGFRLIFRYGLWNKSYPAEIMDRNFLLDFDCFIDDRLIDISEIIDLVGTFNEVVYNRFRKSIDDKLVKIMET